MPSLTPEIIQAAIDGFEAQKARIDTQIAELRGMLTGTPATGAAPPAEPKRDKGRRKMSAATLQRMREGQQRRWAAVKSATPKADAKAAKPKAQEKPVKPKRKISAAGRANLVA